MELLSEKQVLSYLGYSQNSNILAQMRMKTRVHPTQKPIKTLEYLIRLFTDKGDVVIDPCCGSGSTLIAAKNLERKAYGFEIKKEFVRLAKEKMFRNIQKSLF